MPNKVIGGTPQGGQTLCATCRYAHRMRGLNLQEMVICRNNTPVRVSFPVAECSAYDDKRNPALWDMEKIAWEVKSRNRGPVGFAGNEERTITITPPPEFPNQPVPERPINSEIKPCQP